MSDDTVSETGDEVEVVATEAEVQDNPETEVAAETESKDTESPDPSESEPENAEPEPKPKPDKRERAAERRIKRLIAEKKQLEAQLAQGQQVPPKPQVKREDFESDYDFVAAVNKAETEHQATVQQQDANLRQQVEFEVKVDTMYDRAQDLSEDFDPTEFLDNVPVTQTMAEAIIDSDVNAELVIYLNDNPGEADSIAAMSNARQAAAIGKLEAKLTAPKPKPTKSDAPPPVKPVSGAGGSAKSGFYQGMTDAEFEKMRAEQISKR